jgi:DNA-binding SARP family transcriptional activator/WD40 repeat protein
MDYRDSVHPGQEVTARASEDWAYGVDVRFQVLGPVQATVGGSVVEFAGAKERALLARLVLGAGTTVSAAELVDCVWGESPPRTAAKSLQTYVLRLRNTLEPGRHGSSGVLTTEGTGYRLVTGADSVDAEVFARLAGAGHSALTADRPAEAAATLREALALWRGPAYVGVDSPVVRAAARRLEELRIAALEDRLAADLELGHFAVVAAELEQVVGERPYRERSWALLVTALYRSGRQGDALAAYARCRQVLVDEVGVEPGPELKALQARVLSQDPGLLGSRTRPPVVPAALALPGGPLVGRDAEVAALRSFWESSDEPRLLVIRGPAGAGATRLAAELADHVVSCGGVVTLDGAAPDGGLAVYDRPAALPPQGTSGRTLVLARPDLVVPPGVHIVDLTPLPPNAVRELVSTYVGPEDIDVAAARALRASGGWPGAVHTEALGWVRRAASALVASAAVRTGSSSAELVAARDALSDGVLALQDADAQAAVMDPSLCPWPGLAAYDSSDAAYFAGRERLVAEIVARVAASSLVAVVGSSGSGKSSVVRAGLLPALADGVLPGSATWRQLVMRPGLHPMGELARVAFGGSDHQHEAPDDLGTLLERGLRGEAVHEQVVLVVDQFEEVWTACSDVGERRQFLDTVADLAVHRRVLAVPVIRSDFLGDLADHPALAALVGDCTVLVGAPREAEVRRAVALPAQRCGLVLETGLVDAVVDDAGREPGVLPLLSTAMARLWERREGLTLTLQAYVGDGGLSGAIARLAEHLYSSLTPDEQSAARVVLLRLAGPGEGEGVVRRRTPLSELVGLPMAGVTEAVEKLAAARLVTVSEGHAEVAHEALFREWPRLRGWLDDDVTARDLLRRLTVDAAEWDAHDRDDASLWRGTRLLAGAEVALARREEVTPREGEFLAAAQMRADAEQRDAEQRAVMAASQNRRLRRLLGSFAVLLVLALLAGLTAWRAQQEATASRASADAKRLAATSLTEDYLDLALLSAVEAVRSERSPETTGALLTLLGRLPDVLTQVRSRDRFLGGSMSPDRRTMLLWENEPVLQAVDARSGKVRWKADLPGQVVTASVSPDGALVAAAVFAPESPVVMLLDATKGSEVSRLSADDVDGLLPQVAWLAQGQLAVLAPSGVVVVDRADGRTYDPISWQKQPVPGDATMRLLGPDQLVVSGLRVPVAVVDVDRRRARTVGVTGDVLAASPDGTVAAVSTVTSSNDSEVGPTLNLVDTATWKALATAAELPGTDRGVAFDADGSTIAVGAGESVQLRDGRTGELRRELTGHNGTVMGLGFTGGADDLLWSVGRDGSAFQWDLSRQRGVVRSTGSEVATHLADESRDGRVGVALTAHETTPNEAFLFDPQTGRRLLETPLPMPCVCQPWPVAMTPDGTIALGGLDEPSDPQDWGGPHIGRLALWDVPSGTVHSEVALPWTPTGLDISRDGRRAVVNGTDGWAVVDLPTSRVVNLVGDDPMEVLEVPDSAAISPDGRTAALGRARDVVLVSTSSGRELRRRTLPAGDGMLTGTWADADTLVVGGWRGTLHVLRTSDLSHVAPPRLVAPGWITDLVTSRDGRLVASADTDGQLRLYDTASWRPLGKTVLKRQGWGWLSFAPDGRTLHGVFDGDGRVEMTMQPADWIRQACRLAARELTRDEWSDVHPGKPWRRTCRT